MSAVGTMYERLMDALRLQLSRSRSGDHQHVLESIFARVVELRHIGREQRREVIQLASMWPQLHLPPLFAEMYDVPKWNNVDCMGGGGGEF